MTISNYLADLGARLDAEHAGARAAAVTHLQHAMTAGDILIEAKAHLGHGKWLPWLAERGIGERTAQDYMRVARNRPALEAKSAAAADLTLRGAILMLAPQASPEEIEELKLGVLGDGETWLPIGDVIYRPELHCRAFSSDDDGNVYPGKGHDPRWIDQLATILDLVPGIELNQHNEIIDGLARWEAFKRVGATEIRVKITRVTASRFGHVSGGSHTAEEIEHLLLSAERNNAHGLPYIRSEMTPQGQMIFDEYIAAQRAGIPIDEYQRQRSERRARSIDAAIGNG